MMSLTSNELNYLIFRYFHESGLTHSAFALGCEAGLNKSTIDGNMVPPGALITFVQKGIQYLELEANLSNEDVDMDEDFQFVQPLDLITKDAEELRNIIKEKKEEKLQRDKPRGRNKDVENSRGLEHAHMKGKEKEKQQKEIEPEREKVDKDKERDKGKEKDKDKDKEKEKEKVQEDITEIKMTGEKIVSRRDENVQDEVPEPMDLCPSSNSTPCEIPSSDVVVMEGHSSEVFACTWSPDGSLLASGSGDATARIWSIGDPKSSSMQNGPQNVLVLKHFKARTNEKSKDVTTLDWNSEGTLLATGSYDGQARIWNREGELISTLNKHKGPIFSLKWNKKGDYLLSGSVDKTAIVWDVKTGEWKQQFEFHTDPTLDVDWRNNVSFATCSTDTMIYVCKVGENRPIKTFSGHQGEVNAIKWDPSGSLLASCSDDTTAKIWSVKSDTWLHDFREHAKEIYTVRWSPTGPGTGNPNQQLMLASASFDSTIKLWDVEAGRLVNSLNEHRDAVYSVAFSPNGQYLASGSLDRCVNIWSVKDAKVVKKYSGNGGIFEVCWNKEGNRLAAGFANNIVCIIDFRM